MAILTSWCNPWKRTDMRKKSRIPSLSVAGKLFWGETWVASTFVIFQSCLREKASAFRTQQTSFDFQFGKCKWSGWSTVSIKGNDDDWVVTLMAFVRQNVGLHLLGKFIWHKFLVFLYVYLLCFPFFVREQHCLANPMFSLHFGGIDYYLLLCTPIANNFFSCSNFTILDHIK